MLMLAACYGFEDIIEFLLSKRPNLNLKNNQGQTVIDIARSKDYTRILDMIKKSK